MTGSIGRWLVQALGVTAALLGAPAAAPAAVIYDSFGPDFGTSPEGIAIGNDPGNFYQSFAQAFRTPDTSAFVFDRVYLPFILEDNASWYPVTVSLYTSAPGSLGGPDTLVAVLTERTVLPFDHLFDPIFSYAPGGQVILAPDTEYWIVAEVPPIPGSFIQNAWWFAPTFVPNRNAAQTSPGGPWNVFDDQEDLGYLPAAMRVDATAVPAPPAAFLAALGFLSVPLVRRWNRSRLVPQ